MQRINPVFKTPNLAIETRLSCISICLLLVQWTVSEQLFTVSLQFTDIQGVEMTDTPPSDGRSQGAEFDIMGALDWKDGIATLPGSDIRV